MNGLRKCDIYIHNEMYMMEFYSATKKNEILLFTGKWMKLKNILSEVWQVEKAKNSHM
jgi:hypothetical protein